MGLFGPAEPLNARLSSVALGRGSADFKRIGKTQRAILETLAPEERVIFVAAADGEGDGVVWVFTDQRLLAFSGKSLDYELPVARIARTAVKHGAAGRDVRYICSVYWHGDPLKHVSLRNHVNSNGHLTLARLNGEAVMTRIATLIDARIAELNVA